MVPNITVGTVVGNEKEAIETSETFLADVDELLGDEEITGLNWNTVQVINGVEVKTVKVAGKRKRFRGKNLLFRADVKLHGVSAPDFYQFLISKEGYTFIDPDADESDFDKPLLGPFKWKHKSASESDSVGHTQVEYASLDLPFYLKNRDYIVLNSFDNFTRTFLSASCSSPGLGLKGASPYDLPNEKASPSENGRIRMAFAAAYRVHANPENPEECILKTVQWLDMNGWTQPFINNAANKTWFQKFIRRAQERFPATSIQ